MLRRILSATVGAWAGTYVSTFGVLRILAIESGTATIVAAMFSLFSAVAVATIQAVSLARGDTATLKKENSRLKRRLKKYEPNDEP